MKLLYLLFLLPFFTPQQYDAVLGVTQVDSSLVYYEDDLSDFKIDGWDIVAADTANGYILWGDMLAIKENNRWKGWIQPVDKLGWNNDFDLLSAERVNINQKGSDEWVLHIQRNEYGNRGGTEYEYIQIWDTDGLPTLLYSAIVREEFAWFGGDTDPNGCKRTVTYGEGWIKISKLDCVHTENTNEAEADTTSGMFRLVDGEFRRYQD